MLDSLFCCTFMKYPDATVIITSVVLRQCGCVIIFYFLINQVIITKPTGLRILISVDKK